MSNKTEPRSTDLVYVYDGSFDGLMCCVFESYAKNEIPIDIITQDDGKVTLFEKKYVTTDSSLSSRVIKSIPQKMGKYALGFIRKAFLTCLAYKEIHILKFMRLGYTYGGKVMSMLAHDTVDALAKAVGHLAKESHLYQGFVRFSEIEEVLVAQIEPKNIVLPLIADHFCNRYPGEQFIIYDSTNKMALTYKPYKGEIVHIENFSLQKELNKEDDYACLWKVFYDAIEIRERRNEKCRMNHMPKRYWKHMTEMS